MPVIAAVHGVAYGGGFQLMLAADLRFMAGLGERDLYLNPRLTYTGIDQHELFVAAHVFSGSEQTLGGYYSRNDSVMVGWQATF